MTDFVKAIVPAAVSTQSRGSHRRIDASGKVAHTDGHPRSSPKKLSWINFTLAILALGAVSSDATVVFAADNTPNHPAYVRSIIFHEGVVTWARMMTWEHWKIGFGPARPFSEFTEAGIKVHGLTCFEPTIGHLNCYLFMAMKPFESRAHFCEIWPDDKDASGKWPLEIDCPREIDYGMVN
jgi:hypothetical protein